MENNKAIAYIRTSTKLQATSLVVQEEQIRSYAKESGLDIAVVLKDIGVTGKTELLKRPEGRKIRQHLEDGCGHVISSHVDRMFRNTADGNATREAWDTAGVKMHFAAMSEKNMAGSAHGNMFVQLNILLEDYERSRRAERTQNRLVYSESDGHFYVIPVDRIGDWEAWYVEKEPLGDEIPKWAAIVHQPCGEGINNALAHLTFDYYEVEAHA